MSNQVGGCLQATAYVLFFIMGLVAGLYIGNSLACKQLLFMQ